MSHVNQIYGTIMGVLHPFLKLVKKKLPHLFVFH